LVAAKPPTRNRYVEPFAGSAALFFQVAPTRAILADLNPDLINAYRILQTDASGLVRAFKRLPRGKRHYYRIRQLDPSCLSECDRAARFLYLNRYCFNGLYRTNRSGHFNVPYGPPKRGLSVGLPDYCRRLRLAAKLLRGVSIRLQDFDKTVAKVRSGDFVYLDPPYAIDDRRVFREYLPGSFSTLDLPRLDSALAQIDRKGAVFLMSYASSREASALAKKWWSTRVRVRRHVAGFAGCRRSAYELLISNRPISLCKR
jgi:DNA adenine methylase